MRIISKTKDYYDGVQSLGTDLKHIYLREEKELDFKYKIKAKYSRLCGEESPIFEKSPSFLIISASS